MILKNGKVSVLHWCNNCHERSIVRRQYMRKHDNCMDRIEFCLNKGCGYKLMLPFRVLTAEEAKV